MAFSMSFVLSSYITYFDWDLSTAWLGCGLDLEHIAFARDHLIQHRIDEESDEEA
jgi:hypothetical protein